MDNWIQLSIRSKQGCKVRNVLSLLLCTKVPHIRDIACHASNCIIAIQ